MPTMREWLASLDPPLAIAGARGRFSKAGKEAIAKKLAESPDFFSDSPGKNDSPRVKRNSAPKKNSAPKADSVSAAFGDTPAQVWHNAQWYVEENGKKISLSGKEVCRTCGYSLDWQACKVPTYPSLSTGEMLEVRR